LSLMMIRMSQMIDLNEIPNGIALTGCKIVNKEYKHNV